MLKQALRAGRCELALMYGYDLDDDIDHVQVGTAAPLRAGGEGPPAGRPQAGRPEELAGEPMVLLDLPHSSDYLERLVESAGFHPVVRHRTAGFETVRAMVANGLGWSVLNQRPASNMTYDGAEVVPLEIKDEVQPLEIVLASMRGVRLTRRAQAFIRSSGRAARQRAGRRGRPARRPSYRSLRAGPGSSSLGSRVVLTREQLVDRCGDHEAEDPAQVRAVRASSATGPAYSGVFMKGIWTSDAEHVGHDRLPVEPAVDAAVRAKIE